MCVECLCFFCVYDLCEIVYILSVLCVCCMYVLRVRAVSSGAVISTTDNDHWRKQRSYLTGAFMPTSSLVKKYNALCLRFQFVSSSSGSYVCCFHVQYVWQAHIFDKSVERAKVCRERLREMR